MMAGQLRVGDRMALMRPSVDAHTLGISSIGRLLSDCGLDVVVAGADINDAVEHCPDGDSVRLIRDWLERNRISAIGISYRLDPDDALRIFSRFMNALRLVGAAKLGGVREVYFAGLPRACDMVERFFPQVVTFRGDETPAETLAKLGLPTELLPTSSARGVAYDEARLAFGRELVREGDYLSVRPIDRSGYHRFGQRGDSLAARVAHGVERGLPPLMRAHMGPYLPHRKEAVDMFFDWTRKLASSGYLDVLSIGTSQLSQSEFWRSWEGREDGGGVPIASAEEFEEAWRAARPMLVRSYAGTRDVEAMARMLESSIDTAWHALSLWWFSKLDGRGPNSVAENLREHIAALRFIAGTGKPYEPNVPHHFAFRGGDDLSYVLSGFVAAKAAKTWGVQKLVLQVMLNTPKFTWGLQDLSKARALLHLVRELEDGDFKVYLQPRGGLDHFSRDPDKAKAQLAAVTALMDDIEPGDATSPQIIHVVSYSEGFELADPATIDESVKITRHALSTYRELRSRGEVEDMSSNPIVLERTSELIREARAAVAAIESSIRSPYSPEGLYEILASGFFVLPGLSACADEFPEALRYGTACIDGAIVAVDAEGSAVPAKERIALAAENARSRGSSGKAARPGGA